MGKINLKLMFKSKFFWASAIILLLITSITFYALKEKEKALRIYTQEQLARTVVEKKVTENKLSETIKAKEMAQEELAAEKERAVALKKELEEKESQIRLTLDKLEKEMAARREAEARLVIAIKAKRILETKVGKFAKAPKVFELEKIVVKPTPVLAGKILEVNDEHGFVVVDLGKDDNINLGDILSVYRNDKFIGRAQVEKVKEEICAAAILSDWQDREFKKEDEARVL